MKTKRIVLAASMLAFAAISGQAFAAPTISDQRYWPNEVHASTVDAAAASAFQANTPSQAVEDHDRSYDGGPKSDL